MIAGPNCARYLADFGADVIKVERPDGGDSLRNMAWRDPRDGEGLWWKLVNRNKRTIALDLKEADDLDVLRGSWPRPTCWSRTSARARSSGSGLGPDVLLALNPRLVITRVTGFGQTGPYAAGPASPRSPRRCRASRRSAANPTASRCCRRSRSPTRSPASSAAFATMVALHSGVGQVVDVSLLESLFQLMGPLVSLYALTGQQQERLGAGLPYTVPRGTYRCADGKWVGLSRVERLGGGRRAARARRGRRSRGSPRSPTAWPPRRARSGDARLVPAPHPRPQVIAAFTEAEAAIGPVIDMADIAADPHYAAREAIVEVDGTPMQGLLAKLSATPARCGGRAAPSTPTATRSERRDGIDERRTARTWPARCSTRASGGGSRRSSSRRRRRGS